MGDDGFAPHDRRCCGRGLDDIFDPALRDSIGALIDDVRDRGDVAVCDALRRFDGIDLEPSQLRVTADETRIGDRERRGRRRARRRDRTPRPVQPGPDGARRRAGRSRASPG